MKKLFDIKSKTVPYFDWHEKPSPLYERLLIPNATIVAAIQEGFGDMLFQGIMRPNMTSWKSDYHIKEDVVTHSELNYRSIECSILLLGSINYNWKPYGWNSFKSASINLTHTLVMDSIVNFKKGMRISTLDQHYDVSVLEYLFPYMPELVGPFLENYYAGRNFTLFESGAVASPTIFNLAKEMHRLLNTPGELSPVYDMYGFLLLALTFLWKAELLQRRGLTKKQAEMAMKFQTICQYIQNNDEAFMGIPFYAEMALMSTTTFKKYFHELAGSTPFKFRVNDRLHKAAGFLSNTNDSISDIAFEVGFGDIRAFDKAFKKKYHETPSDFREKARNEK